MKKFGYFVFVYLTVLLCVSCSIPAKKPESGFWYCEELNTGIDFDLYQTTLYCIKVYNDDGSVKINGCHIDYGTGILFFDDSDGNYNEYFYGNFKYNKKKEQFIIESYPDGIIYAFVKREKTKLQLYILTNKS